MRPEGRQPNYQDGNRHFGVNKTFANESLSLEFSKQNLKHSASYGVRENRKEPFGLFSERILEIANHVFSPMYRRIFKGYWHNSMIARMSRNYCVTQWSQGLYEIYIPTRRNPEVNMQYYRITIKVLPEADKETVRNQLVKLLPKHVDPAGIVDSELFCFVTPKRSEKARSEKQFLRGFKHVMKPGYLTAIILNPVPEIAMKRLLTLVVNFLKRRIGKLLEKLNFQPWQYDYREKNYLYYSQLVSIIEGFSYSIANTLRSLSHSLNWILMKLKWLLKEIGRQNMLRMAMKKFSEFKSLLSEANVRQPALISQMETILVAATARSSFNLRTRKPKAYKPEPVAPSNSVSEDLAFLEMLKRAKPAPELDKAVVHWGGG